MPVACWARSSPSTKTCTKLRRRTPAFGGHLRQHEPTSNESENATSRRYSPAAPNAVDKSRWLVGKQSSTTKDRDFGESDLVGRSPKVAQRPFCAVPVLTDFALRVKLPVRHQPPSGLLPQLNSHHEGRLRNAEAGVRVAFQGGRAEVGLLAGGVQIPEASLQWVCCVHRACPRWVERHIDCFAGRAHRLLGRELEVGSLF